MTAIETRRTAQTGTDRGSALPLLIGFLTIGLLVSAAAIAVGDAAVHQSAVQSVCDGAALAVAAAAADLARGDDIAVQPTVRFAAVRDAVDRYLAAETPQRSVQIAITTSQAGHRVDLTCTATVHVTFGALFGRGSGVRQVAYASAGAVLA